MGFTPQNLKRGTIFRLEGHIYQSLEYRQAVQARQQGSVTVRARNLKTNKILNYTFRGGEDLTEVNLNKENVQFLYRDRDNLHFMNASDFSQYQLPASVLGEQAAYLVAEQKLILLLEDDHPLMVEMPKNVWLKVESAPAVVKGDTTSAVFKDVRLAGGLTVKVPAFIKAGDVISVDTATGAYRERQK